VSENLQSIDHGPSWLESWLKSKTYRKVDQENSRGSSRGKTSGLGFFNLKSVLFWKTDNSSETASKAW